MTYGQDLEALQIGRAFEQLTTEQKAAVKSIMATMGPERGAVTNLRAILLCGGVRPVTLFDAHTS